MMAVLALLAVLLVPLGLVVAGYRRGGAGVAIAAAGCLVVAFVATGYGLIVWMNQHIGEHGPTPDDEALFVVGGVSFLFAVGIVAAATERNRGPRSRSAERSPL